MERADDFDTIIGRSLPAIEPERLHAGGPARERVFIEPIAHVKAALRGIACPLTSSNKYISIGFRRADLFRYDDHVEIPVNAGLFQFKFLLGCAALARDAESAARKRLKKR